MARSRFGSLLPALSTTLSPTLSAPAGRRWRRRDLLTHIRRLVAEGVLAPGDRLPSTRTLAEEFGLSRSTVEVVFDDLVAAGLIERRQGSGSHVAAMLGELPAPMPASPLVARPGALPGPASAAARASVPAIIATSGRATQSTQTTQTTQAGRPTQALQATPTPASPRARTPRATRGGARSIHAAAHAEPERVVARDAPTDDPGLSARGALLGASTACREPEIVRPFNAGIPDAAAFPHDAWQRSVTRAWRTGHMALLTQFEPLGHRPLREAIWRYLTTFRGVRCTAEQVAITSSSQSALHLLALLLVNPGDRVWLENPGYPGAQAAMIAAGAQGVAIPVDAHGLRVDVAQRRAPDARLAYVTPSHQYPSGVTLALDRRIALLAWAAAGARWIVEDDYDGEFRYAGLPSAALQGLDRAGRVIYIGTLSKVLSPALRLAYIVMPPALVEPFANLRAQIDGFTATPLQAALADFFETGQFEAHVRRMRTRYAQKHDALVQALARMAPDAFEPAVTEAGFHTTLLERVPGLARRVTAAAPAYGLSLDALNRYAIAPLDRDGLMLRYGALSLEAIDDGARRLQQLIAAVRG